MSESLQRLEKRIQAELMELEIVVERVESGWLRAKTSGDDLYIDSVALNLHSFYSGIERIIERIAEAIDGTVPRGENWHQALLLQMTRDVPGIRPAVISPDTYERLNQYRGFRHVVRNVYTFQFDPAKVERLVADADTVLTQTRTELLAFAQFLGSANLQH